MLVATVSQLAVKYATSYLSSPDPLDAAISNFLPPAEVAVNGVSMALARSALHSLVQPPVNALGNQATTTGCLPLKSARE